jgi:hypothetical protein
MKLTTARTIGALALTAALAQSLAGCSSTKSNGTNSASSKAAQAAINTAVDLSVAKGSAAVVMSSSSSKKGQSATTTEAVGLVAFDGTAGQLAMAAGSTRAIEHVGNGVAYVKVSSTSLPAAAKNKWIRVKLTDTTHLTRLGVGTLPPVAQILMQLKGLGGTASKVGQVTINNKVVTKYEVIISKDQLIANASKIYGPTSNTVAQLKAVPADTHATVNVYVGTDGLIAREIESLSLPVLGVVTTSQTKMDLTNYGTSIPLGHPAAGDVIDVAALFSNTNGSSSGGVINGGTTVVGN